jgi:hypothetical protein
VSGPNPPANGDENLTATPAQPWPKTRAYLAFERNCDDVMVLVKGTSTALRGVNSIGNDAVRLVPVKVAEMLKGGKIISRAEIDEEIRSFESLVQVVMDMSAVVHSWILVMVVTFAETYLHDILADCAALDPGLMNDSQQSATFEDIDAASSLVELKAELTSRWASNWIQRRGGPRKFVSTLHDYGARGFEATAVDALEELWGIRHVIVHRAGYADASFVRRHPSLGIAIGERIAVTDDHLKRYLTAMKNLIDTTDRFFSRRYEKQIAAANTTS